MNNYIPATGNHEAKILVLGDSPGYSGKQFEGRAQYNLDKLLQESRINKSDCWFSTVSKYHVPDNPKGARIPFAIRAKNSEIDLPKELSDLQNEINSIKPNVILGLGQNVLWALTGKTNIKQLRGSILTGMGKKFIPTYSTSLNEFTGYWNRSVMLFDFIRAKNQSEFSEIERPNRFLSIARNSHQLSEFQSRFKNHSRPAIDIEARGQCLPACIGISFTPSEGITVPLWNFGEYKEVINCTDSEMIQMWIILSDILANNDVVGQNFKYDHDKIRRLGFDIRSLASDTMLKGHTIYAEFSKNLAFYQSIYTEEPFYKDEGMYEGTLTDLFMGCARDSCVTKEIDLGMDADLDELKQRPYYENFMLQLHNMYLDIESEGFLIDYSVRDKLFKKYIHWSESLSHELFCLTGDYINVNSPKQVHVLLYETMNLPIRKGTGEEEITAILNTKSSKLNDEKRRTLEVILEKRRIDKTIGTYLMALPDFDHKMKTTYFLCLETGRTSTGQLDPPIRPAIEMENEQGKKIKKVIGTAFQTMTKHGDIGADVRSQYIAPPGYIFLQADSSQAEARVVFLLANDEQALHDIDHHDYHALTASWFFGGTEDDYSKKKLGYESPIRFAGKTLRHAGHLGAGKRRASTELNTQARKYKIPITINEGIADRALKVFHLKQPNIQQVFHRGVIETLKNNKRYLTAGVPYGLNISIGGTRQFFEQWEDELFRQAFSYIPQRSVTDNTKAAGIRLRKKEPKLTRIILEAHDALLFLLPESELNSFAPLVKQEFERPISFDNCSLSRHDLIIPCELEIGYNYMELNKFKEVK